jgi:hypothetical protein
VSPLEAVWLTTGISPLGSVRPSPSFFAGLRGDGTLGIAVPFVGDLPPLTDSEASELVFDNEDVEDAAAAFVDATKGTTDAAEVMNELGTSNELPVNIGGERAQDSEFGVVYDAITGSEFCVGSSYRLG